MSSENSENRNIESNNDQLKEDNALKKNSGHLIQKVDLKQSFFSATETAGEWIKISNEFIHTKKSLRSYRNELFEFLFEKLGYRYSGNINHPSFLHLSAEAWLIGIFQELEIEINSSLNNITFHSLINLIANAIVKENAFIENMEMLIGRFSYLEPFAKEEKIFRGVLIDLNSTKNEVLKDDKILKNIELSYENFVGIIEKILRIGFNVFLNNINSAEENKKSTLLYENFKALRKQQNTNLLSFEDFVKAYTKAKSFNEIPSENLRHQLLGYFEFSRCSLEDLRQEVSCFNKNVCSIIFKVFAVLPKIYLFDFMRRKLEFLKSFPAEGSGNCFKIENMRSSFAQCYKDSKGRVGEALFYADDKRKELFKKWLKMIPAVQSAANGSYDFYAIIKGKYSECLSYSFLRINSLFSPFKNVVLTVKENLRAFVLVVRDKSAGSALYVQKAVFGFIARNFQAVKTAMIGNEPMFRVNSKDDNFYSVEINKKLFVIKPELFPDFLMMLRGFLGTVYDLRFAPRKVAGDVNRKIMEVAASSSQNEPIKQSIEMHAANNYEKLKEN